MAEKKKTTLHALGRRKESVCTLNMEKGAGENIVNGKKLEEYFTERKHKAHIFEPFIITGTTDDYHFTARVSGGGLVGQSGALRLAIARALAAIDPQMHVKLSTGGVLIRDPRAKERKKVFFVRARKKPQFSKR
jgi:small subunit ribosomal protein S9